MNKETLDNLDWSDIKEHGSPFGNYYGSLIMAKIDGDHYLHMQDHSGYDYFGPLTAVQVAAFHVLSDIKKIE